MSSVLVTGNLYSEKNYINAQGETIALEQALQTADTILYYVAGRWCPNSKDFTPTLIEFYNKVNASSKKLEIIYLSLDATESDFKEQSASFPWLSIPFSSNVNVRKWVQDNDITKCPAVLLVRKEDGVLTLKTCRADIINKKEACLDEWAAYNENFVFDHKSHDASKISHKSLLK